MVKALKQVCPPGVFCLTPGVLILGLFILVVIGILLFPTIAKTSEQVFVTESKPQPLQPQPIAVINAGGGGDDRYTRAPRPQRVWDNGPEFPPRGALMSSDGTYILNEPTRGLPEQYQSMGMLKTGEGKILPLYGRRTAYGTDRYNYYTRTDTYNPVPLPIKYKRRDCQEDTGCDELMSGDTVQITPLGQQATATLYKFDGPMYVPGLL